MPVSQLSVEAKTLTLPVEKRSARSHVSGTVTLRCAIATSVQSDTCSLALSIPPGELLEAALSESVCEQFYLLAVACLTSDITAAASGCMDLLQPVRQLTVHSQSVQGVGRAAGPPDQRGAATGCTAPQDWSHPPGFLHGTAASPMTLNRVDTCPRDHHCVAAEARRDHCRCQGAGSMLASGLNLG